MIGITYSFRNAVLACCLPDANLLYFRSVALQEQKYSWGQFVTFGLHLGFLFLFIFLRLAGESQANPHSSSIDMS